MNCVSRFLVIFLIATFIFNSVGLCDEVKDECVSVKADSAAKMVVELESCRVRVEQLGNIQLQNEELKKQIIQYQEKEELYKQKEELYKQIIELQKLQLVAAEDAIKKYREHIEFIQNSYKELLKQAKPNPIIEFLKSILFIGAGVAAGSVIR